MRLRERPRHNRCTPLQQKLWEGTRAVPGPRRCPHPPHRGHPGRRGRMACQPCPRQLTWLQRASRQLQGEGGRETTDVLVLYVMYGVINEVWCRPCPTNLQSPTQKIAEMAAREHRETHNVEQTKKMIPFVTQKTSFG